MSKSVVTQYQPSITEWFASIGQKKEAEIFRREDNEKNQRFEILHETIGFPYEIPEKFSAIELKHPSKKFVNFLKKQGDQTCAIRLVPKDPNLPKLRNRGLKLNNCYKNWFLQQKIDSELYEAHIYYHWQTMKWSDIFVIKENIVFGEIVRGMHAQLTHGDIKNQTYQFIYDFKTWQWSQKNDQAQKEIKRTLKFLLVKDVNKQKILEKKLNLKFTNNYLMGYFEGLVWPDNSIHFTDFNRFLSNYILTPPKFSRKTTNNLSGVSAYLGKVVGRVVKVNEKNLNSIKFPVGSILVCNNTDVRYLPMMKKASAIVTDHGGILSHAAIIARELKKPCIIGTKIATKVLKDGDLVEVDANKGIVKILLP